MFDRGRTPLDNRSPPSAQPQSDAKVLGWVIRSTDRDEQPEPVSQPRRPTRAAERSEGETGVRVAEPPLAASAAPPHKRRRRPAPRSPRTRVAHRLRGRYWDRTSDLFRVREARYRCANRPRNPQTTEVLEVETGFEPVYTALQAVASPLGHSTECARRPKAAKRVSTERTTGFEPATPTLARLCATSCATSAWCTRSPKRRLKHRRKTLADPD